MDAHHTIAHAAGTYVQSGSASNTSPVIDHARAREPPQRSRNSQRPHRLLGSRPRVALAALAVKIRTLG